MMNEGFNTVKELAGTLEFSQATIRRWIAAKKLSAVMRNGRYEIPFEPPNNQFIMQLITAKHNRPTMPYVPAGLENYNEWHGVIDELTWLFKVTYSDIDQVKTRKFRADHIFITYLKRQRFSLETLSRAFLKAGSYPLPPVTADLKRGWYNELSYLMPFKASTLGLSFRDIDANSGITDQRFVFPSWRIITFYYAVYFYLRALTLQKMPGYRIAEHGTALAVFKTNLQPVLEKYIWGFPLSIAFLPGTRVIRATIPPYNMRHLQCRYSFHPRAPHRSPSEIFERIYGTFRRLGKTRAKPMGYSLFDYFHDLRIWANYTDIESMLLLWGKGYKGFLDQNLSFLLFMIGGITELGYMSANGSDRYFSELQELYDSFIKNNDTLENGFINSSLYQRMCIYKEMGFISERIRLQTPNNINEIRVQVNGTSANELRIRTHRSEAERAYNPGLD